MRSTGMHKTEPDIVTQVRRRLIRRYFHGIGARISETWGRPVFYDHHTMASLRSCERILKITRNLFKDVSGINTVLPSAQAPPCA